MTTVDVTGSGVSRALPTAAVRERLLAIHAGARSNPALQRLAVISRLLLAMAFIPTSLIKILGQRFTVIPIENPVGFFFEAMYRSGEYWQFIGCTQLAAGILILIPRTATLGAVMFFPIILNIFVITVSMQFKGTPVVTGGMLLASLFLLVWDYHRFEAILFASGTAPEDRWGGPGEVLERVAFLVGGAAGMTFFLGTRGFATRHLMMASIVVGLLAAATVAFAWLRAWRMSRAARRT